MIECQGCGGEAQEMGSLGNAAHYRCRDCGLMSFNVIPVFKEDDAFGMSRRVAAVKGGKASRGGGRPKIPDDELTEKQRKRRLRNERYRKKKAGL